MKPTFNCIPSFPQLPKSYRGWQTAWFRASAARFRFRCRTYLHDALMTTYLLFRSSYWLTETVIHSYKARQSQWFKSIQIQLYSNSKYFIKKPKWL